MCSSDLGTYNAPGDDASGGPTTCDAIICEPGYRVQNHVCTPCGVNTYNDRTDDASGIDTQCTNCETGTYQNQIGQGSCIPILCDENEYVDASKNCQPCPAGTYNAPGDDATNGPTTCDAVICEENYHVVNHVCTPCSTGTRNPDNHDASGHDTACDPILCDENEYVNNDKQCQPCPAGTYNAPGDNASGDEIGRAHV